MFPWSHSCPQPNGILIGSVVSVGLTAVPQFPTYRPTQTDHATFVATGRIFALSACTHTHPFNGPFSRTTQVSRDQKGKTNLNFTEARDSEWQWHQLGRMQVCISLKTDNRASTPSLFLQAGCPPCRPTNSIKALKAAMQPKNIP